MTDVRWRRFHPAAIAFNALQALGGLALPIVVAMLRGGSLGSTVVYGLIGVVLATGAGVLRWATNRWRVTDTAIGHLSGWLSVKERSVPLARVQSLDAVRGPVQRLLGVVTVHVQTAGGGRAGEIVLPALTARDLAALQAAAGVGAAPEPGEVQRRLGAGALLVAGLTAGSASLLVAAAAGAAQLAQQLYGDDRPGAELDAVQRLAPGSALSWVLAVAVLLALAWLLGVLGTVIAFAGFRVTRDGDRLRIRRGLLSQRDSAVPVGRVQAVRVVEGVLRQPFGLAAVRIDVLGAGAEPPSNQTLFPLLRRGEVAGVLAELLPEHAGDPTRLRPAPRRSARRYALPLALAGFVAGGLAWWLVPWAGWWALALGLLGAWWGLERWRAAGWRLDADRAALRFRRLARTTVLFQPRRVQWAQVDANPLQQHADLADVRVSVGKGARARVRHLEASAAWTLWRAARLT